MRLRRQDHALGVVHRARRPDELVGLVPVDRRELDRAKALRLSREGYSIRRISYLTGIPRSTVGDLVKSSRPTIVAASPFSRLVPL